MHLPLIQNAIPRRARKTIETGKQLLGVRIDKLDDRVATDERPGLDPGNLTDEQLASPIDFQEQVDPAPTLRAQLHLGHSTDQHPVFAHGCVDSHIRRTRKIDRKTIPIYPKLGHSPKKCNQQYTDDRRGQYQYTYAKPISVIVHSRYSASLRAIVSCSRGVSSTCDTLEIDSNSIKRSPASPRTN